MNLKNFLNLYKINFQRLLRKIGKKKLIMKNTPAHKLKSKKVNISNEIQN
jgi:hypothetical protein